MVRVLFHFPLLWWLIIWASLCTATAATGGAGVLVWVRGGGGINWWGVAREVIIWVTVFWRGCGRCLALWWSLTGWNVTAGGTGTCDTLRSLLLGLSLYISLSDALLQQSILISFKAFFVSAVLEGLWRYLLFIFQIPSISDILHVAYWLQRAISPCMGVAILELLIEVLDWSSNLDWSSFLRLCPERRMCAISVHLSGVVLSDVVPNWF